MKISDKTRIEDFLINKMIENDLSIFDPNTSLEGEPMYKTFDQETKDRFDINALEYFRNAHKAKSEQNSVYNGLEFQNFVKMFNPTNEFLDVMRREEVSESDPAMVWHKYYNQDLNLMKESALNGLKTVIAEGG